jgi:hypothetical protein
MDSKGGGFVSPVEFQPCTVIAVKTLRTYGNLAEAGFAKSLLEAAEIPAEIADEQMYWRGVTDYRIQYDALGNETFLPPR